MDDATGTVPAALFCREEDTPSYFLLMNKLIQQCGIPLAYYSDRHPVIKFTGDIDRYPAGPTQFARAMEELGIRQIFARSPQAKELVSEVEASHDNRSKRELTGRIIVPDSLLTQRRPFKSTIVVRQNTFETGSKGRVERAAGTIQDRLVTELRLAGAVTIAEANEVLNGFLPRFNERFGVQAEQDCPAYRFLEHSVSLDGILCFKHRRKASRDNTVKYNRRTLQLPPGVTRPTFAGMQVEVQEDLVGRLLVQYQGRQFPRRKLRRARPS